MKLLSGPEEGGAAGPAKVLVPKAIDADDDDDDDADDSSESDDDEVCLACGQGIKALLRARTAPMSRHAHNLREKHAESALWQVAAAGGAADTQTPCTGQDDEAALMAELARIRKERAEEAQRKAAQEAAERQEALQQEVATGNPLLNQSIDFQVGLLAWTECCILPDQSPILACKD